MISHLKDRTWHQQHEEDGKKLVCALYQRLHEVLKHENIFSLQDTERTEAERTTGVGGRRGKKKKQPAKSVHVAGAQHCKKKATTTTTNSREEEEKQLGHKARSHPRASGRAAEKQPGGIFFRFYGLVGWFVVCFCFFFFLFACFCQCPEPLLPGKEAAEQLLLKLRRKKTKVLRSKRAETKQK